MATSAYKSVGKRKKVSAKAKTVPTSVKAPISGRTDMVKNHDGAFVFDAGKWATLNRFLILGSEGGTYYTGEQKLTLENTVNLLDCIREDGFRVVDTIVNISVAGRAPKNTPALFALAVCARPDNPDVAAYALSKLPEVARIPTHLFDFLTFLTQFRGFGRGVRKAVASFYDQFNTDKLAYEVVKYQSRNGMSNADVLRLTHPNSNDPVRQAVYRWVLGLDLGARKIVASKDGSKPARKYGKVKAELPEILTAFDALKGETNPKKIVKAIETYNLTREMVPTEALNHGEVWEALLQKMPLNALIRNLGNMSKAGLFGPNSDSLRKAVSKLTDADYVIKSRVHPLGVLVALKTYASGRGLRGSGEWKVSQRIVDTLDYTFYLSFGGVEPTGKRLLYGIDVSSSMTWGSIAGLPLTAREASAALAMVTARTERDYHLMGFSHTLVPLHITPKMRLDAVMSYMDKVSFGATDVSLPMKYARTNKIPVDAFQVITDNETNYGNHPMQELQKYRQTTGIQSKLIVCGMTATNFTVADPKDPLTLDVVGFDTAAPAVISEFIRA